MHSHTHAHTGKAQPAGPTVSPQRGHTDSRAEPIRVRSQTRKEGDLGDKPVWTQGYALGSRRGPHYKRLED